MAVLRTDFLSAQHGNIYCGVAVVLASFVPLVRCSGPHFPRNTREAGRSGQMPCLHSGICKVGVDGHIEGLARNSYTVVRGVLLAEEVIQARRALPTASLKLPDDPPEMKAYRVFNLLFLDPIFGSILEAIPADVDGLIKDTLGPWYVGSYHALVLQPQEHRLSHAAAARLRTQRLHADYPFGEHAAEIHGHLKYAVKPSYPRTFQLLFMLDDFTEESGATQIWPGSHLQPLTPSCSNQTDRELFAANSHAVEGKAGDMLVYFGLAWHAYGVNTGSQPRRALLVQCLPYYMRPMENHATTLPAPMRERMSPGLRLRLGIYPEFKFEYDMGVPVVM